MKTILFLFCVAFITCTANNASAKIWRVNNNGYSADFAQLQAANDNNNVSNGDTIHLEGSSTLYLAAAISKKLIIIGPGYFLNENLNTTSTKVPAKIPNIAFNSGSAGSELKGVYVGGTSFGVSINVSDMVIFRCRIDDAIFLASNIANIKIIQNFFFGKFTTNAINASGFGFPTDVFFNNNICQKILIFSNDTYTFQECNNNVFDCPTVSNGPSLKFQSANFYNNILTNSNATVNINAGNTTYVDYNISTSSNNQFGISKNNIVVSDTTTLFVGARGNSTDGAFQLKPNSPGSNNGSDGTDRGVFGGVSPANHYTLSGLPDIPVIYSITSPGVAAGNLPVTIKAKTVQ